MDTDDEAFPDDALRDSMELINMQMESLLLRRHGVTHIQQLSPPQRAVLLGQFHALWRQMLRVGIDEFEYDIFDVPYTPNVRPLREDMYSSAHVEEPDEEAALAA